MRYWISGLILSLTPAAWASCLTVPAPGVPRQYRQAVAYSVAFKSGHNEVPYATTAQGQRIQVSQTDSGQVCFDTFDPTGIVTDATLLTEHQAQEADRQAAAALEAQREAEFQTEVTGSGGNDLCNAELSVIATKLTQAHDTLATAIGGVGTLAQAKTTLGQMNDLYFQIFNKVSKCVRARAR